MLTVVAATGCAQLDSSSDTAELQRAPVALQFLSISDWHAQLDPFVVSGQQVGGAAVLSSYFKAERAANPNTLTLTGGDAFGASPPLSMFFDDTPAIRAMNLMGIDVDTLGNHNFDKGTAYLQARIDEAAFPYIAANLVNIEENLVGVAPYRIFTMGGVKVAVVGATNFDAPELVKPGSFGTIEVRDPVPALNAARARAQAEGAQVTVAIVHMGITGVDATTGLAFGPLIDLTNNIGGFDFVFGDHTDFQYSGIHNNALVVENKSKGRTYARVRAAIDPGNGRVIDRGVEFITPLASAVTPDQAILDMLAPYRQQLTVLKSVVIGSSTVAIRRADSCGRGDGRLCESLIGNVVTDAMRHDTDADFAITNSGGIRADLTCPSTNNPFDFCPAFTGTPLPITNGQVQTVLPFGNIVVQSNITGAELKAMLENGVAGLPGAVGRFPQVSGLCATYDIARVAGSRVTSVVRQAADGSCTGATVDLTAAASYVVLQNDFMASGGDGYPNVSARTSTLDFMDNTVIHYLSHESPVSPTIQGRLRCTSSGAAVCPTQL
ncbi:MAG: 5'-nucleotidase C-terminal domain-containing protein [Myxococcota bacterium]|nr:5'-nucleotidase C-terminal domain-containing protein [Myxococcota bacterium]